MCWILEPLAKRCDQLPSFSGIPQSNLHLDILMGRYELIEPADIFLGSYFLFLDLIYTEKKFTGMETSRSSDTHKEMEKKYRI